MEDVSEPHKVQNRRRVSPYYIAGVYLILEKKAHAFAWLETSYAEGEWWMVFLHVDLPP